MNPNLLNLWFDGGGVWGVAFVGVIAALEKADQLRHFKNFGGLSIGSVFALLLAIGYRWQELYTICMDPEQPLAHLLLDRPRAPWYYVQPGEQLETWLQKCLRHKGFDGRSTFAQLFAQTGRILCVLVGDRVRQETVVCDPLHTPEASVAQTVRYSCALPGLFQPGKDDKGRERWVDGGLYWSGSAKQLFGQLYYPFVNHNTVTVGFTHCDQPATKFNYGWNRITTLLRLANVVRHLKRNYADDIKFIEQQQKSRMANGGTPDICLQRVTWVSSPVEFQPSNLVIAQMMCIGYEQTMQWLATIAKDTIAESSSSIWSSVNTLSLWSSS